MLANGATQIMMTTVQRAMRTHLDEDGGWGGGGMIFQINLGTVAPSCALGQYCTGGQRVQMRSSSH